MKADLYVGDCLDVLQRFSESTIDLIYLDPPFLTQKTQRLRTRDRQREFRFPDSWNSESEYANFLFSRLSEMHRVLKPTASLYLHCDRKAVHIARFLLDEIFGRNMFRSEIIWSYKRWSNSQTGLLPAHQTILFYSRSSNFTFNPAFEEYSLSTNVDQILQKRKRDSHGKTVYARDSEGGILPSDAKRGVPLSDVWDMPYLNPKAKERVGYPTQKPLHLLERIIQLSSNPGDTVLDPFCGSGTTVVAAVESDRRAIGIDILPDAIEVTRARLSNPIRSESAVLMKGRNSYRNSSQYAQAHLVDFNCIPVQRNRGIDAILKELIQERPVPVRVQRSGESLDEAAQLLAAAGRKKQAAMMILVTTQQKHGLDLGLQLPEGILLIPSASKILTDYLTESIVKD